MNYGCEFIANMKSRSPPHIHYTSDSGGVTVTYLRGGARQEGTCYSQGYSGIIFQCT